jgi:hypothetical protein
MLTLMVIEIAPQGTHSIIRVQVGSTSLSVTTGDVFSVAVTPEISDMNSVGQPLVTGD